MSAFHAIYRPQYIVRKIRDFYKPPPPQRVRHMYEARLDKIYELHVSLYMYMMYVTLQPLGVDQTFMPYMKAMYEGTVA